MVKNDSGKGSINLDSLLHHTQLPETSFSRMIDGFLRKIGEAASWVWVLLLLVIVVNVALRHFFSQGRIEFEELQWHIYAVGFLLGLSYCYQADDHIRVDVLHEKMSLKARAIIELVGIVVLLIPFIVLVLVYSVPFVHFSFSIGEVSDAPGGLGARWLIKAALPVSFLLLLLGAVSRLTRVLALLSRTTKPQHR